MPVELVGEPFVSVEALTVRLRRRTVLDGVSFVLGAGVHGLLGLNGAGKTTLVRALATVLSPTSGTVRLLPDGAGGPAPSLREVRRHVGYLPQQFGWYPRFTAREYVEYLAWLKEMPPAAVPLAVDRALERVGLRDRADDTLKTLSGGMIRRVGIAQAIVNDPAVLLLDEPTAGLDPPQQELVHTLLADLGRDTCVVVATPTVADVAAVCDGVLLLAGGQLVYSGTPAGLAATAELTTRTTDTADATDTTDTVGTTDTAGSAGTAGTAGAAGTAISALGRGYAVAVTGAPTRAGRPGRVRRVAR